MVKKIYKKGIVASTGILLLAGLSYFSFDMYRSLQQESPHYVDDGCAVCHYTLGDNVLEALHTSEIELCTSCHDREGDVTVMSELGNEITVSLGESHPWGLVPSEENSPATLPLYDGFIVCSTCHDVHLDNSESHMLRLYEAQEGQEADYDPLCRDCHVRYF